ncbi:MAG TPA: glycosyltransferase family 2 protein, partial [Agriterribacter sp.]|nr:glycosyltransferase family 2 protein [Agriterribacter sp.]
MTISGFTIVRNATKLYYPVKASIQSILPLVDEFIVAIGDCDEDDHTLEEIQSIGSDKIRIIHTVWDMEKYPGGTAYACQTDIAKNQCKGDWLFYLQSDEVIHEKYLPAIKERCEALLNDSEVEGLLFNYKHFWGDYNHYIESHGWYAKEIRIIRNLPYIHSWGDAQSFRRIPDFDGVNYYQKKGAYKLKVAHAGAAVYHYGWVRPPRYMQNKQKVYVSNYKGAA